jgi:hypothetical protein
VQAEDRPEPADGDHGVDNWVGRVVAIGCAALGTMLAIDALTAERWAPRLAAGVGAATFALIAVWGWRRSIRGALILHIAVRDDGIELHDVELIRWDEIERVRFYRWLGIRQLGIWTRDRGLVARRSRTRFARVGWALARLLRAAPITLGPEFLDLDQIHAEIAARRPELVSERAP